MSALIWLSYLSLVMLGLLDCIRGPFFPDVLQELGLNSTQGAFFFATTSMVAFIGSFTSHRIVRQHTSLFLLAIACAAVALGFCTIARAHSLFLFFPACALFGWGYGALNLAQNLIIYEAAPIAKRRQIFTGLHAMYGLAAFSAPVVASLFRWLGAGWRECFVALAFLPAVLVIWSLGFKGKSTRKEPHGPPLTRTEWFACALFSLMLAGYLWGEISATTRVVQWLRADHAFAPDQANLYLAGFCGTLLAGRVVFSFLHFRSLGNWTILLVSAGLGSVAYLLALRHDPIWIVVTGLMLSPFYPVAMDQVSLTFGVKNAEALGFVIGAGSLSVVLMHVTIGVLTDAVGVGHALYVGPATLAMITLALVIRQLRTVSRQSP